MKFLKIYLILIVFITSCEFLNFKDSPDNKAIARVHDKYLYESDIRDLVPENASKEDSIAIVENYIYLWAKQRLLLYNSELNLSINKDEYEKLVNEYREDLYINAYREAVVNQYTDTIISANEIESYYNTNKESFHLNEELVKMKYILIGKEIQNPIEFTRLFTSGKQKDIEKIIENEYKLKSHNFNDSTWIRFADIQQKLPILKKIERASSLPKSTIIQKQDSLGIYLIKVKDLLTINDVAPLNYVSSNIKQMILHKRKQELLKKIEETLVTDAIKNKQFEEFK